MVVRVDTTNLTRGLEFSIIVHTQIEPTITLYAFNTTTHQHEVLPHVVSQEGQFYKATSKAPSFDGYLLAKINSKYAVVKKIGHPRPHFVIGYKANYTVPYKMYDTDGVELVSANLVNITGGFYYCVVPKNTTVIETLKKRFIIKENLTKLNYEVTMSDSTLDDVVLPDYTLNTTLSDATLPDVVLSDVSTNATLPEITITEF